MTTIQHVISILQEAEFHHGTLPDRGAMPVPFPVLTVHVPLDKQDPRAAGASIQTIPLNMVHATQRTVDANNLRKFIDTPDIGGIPLVVRYGDGYAIVDGHHRLAAQRLRGQTHADVKVLDEDAPANASGHGGVAGLGVGPQGEPGVRMPRKKKSDDLVEGVSAADYERIVRDLATKFNVQAKDVNWDSLKFDISTAKRLKDNTVDGRTRDGKRFHLSLADAQLFVKAHREILGVAKRLFGESKITVKRIATAPQANADFWQIGDSVFRAPIGIGTDSTGQPMGKRWECSIDHWKRYRSVFAWAQDINEEAHDTFAGADVFDVPLDTIVRTPAPKKPWERFSRYIGQDEDAENIRLHARKEWKKNIILRDSRSGVMTYLRKRAPRG